MAGIIGYGAYLPFTRIKVEEIHKVWRNTSLDKLKNVLMVHERAVLQPNEDTVTLAVAAAKEALSQSGVDREKINAIFLGTCTNPYDSRPSVTIVSEAIGTSPHCHGRRHSVFGKVGNHGHTGLSRSRQDRAWQRWALRSLLTRSTVTPARVASMSIPPLRALPLF